MKCDECLPLIEEYADGELEAAACEVVSTHLAACLACSEAFDALVGEQELYVSYVRDVEVTPAMWESVRAEVFAKPARETVAPLPFLARLRQQLDATFGGLRFSPALAGAMALLVVGVAAGVVDFVQLKDDAPQTNIAAVTNAGKDSGSTQRAVVGTKEVENVEPAGSASSGRDASEPSRLTQTTETTATRAARVAKAVESGGARSLPGGVAKRERAIDAGRFDDAHAVALNEDPLLAPPKILVDPDEDPIRKDARALNVEEREVARHIERAQMLLLSFRNVRLADGREGEATGDVAYERQLSRELLDRNVSLRINAELSGNLPARQVLDSLEPFLLDIANIKDDSSHDEVRSIKERIQKDEIIAALQVY